MSDSFPVHWAWSVGSVSPLPLHLSLSASLPVTDSPTHLRHWGVNRVFLVCFVLHTHSFFLSLSLSPVFLHHLSPSNFQALPFFSASLAVCVGRTGARVHFSCSGGGPFVFVKSSLTGDIIARAVLFTAGKCGWTTLGGLPGSDSSSSNSVIQCQAQ